jgi:hypothetical protein
MDTLPPKDKMCRFSGFQRKCRDLVCEGSCTDAWQHIQGMHPQTGERLSKWGCCYDFAYLFAIEAAGNAQQARADTLMLRNMIFVPEIRERELSKTDHTKTIEDKTDADHDHR